MTLLRYLGHLVPEIELFEKDTFFLDDRRWGADMSPAQPPG